MACGSLGTSARESTAGLLDHALREQKAPVPTRVGERGCGSRGKVGAELDLEQGKMDRRVAVAVAYIKGHLRLPEQATNTSASPSQDSSRVAGTIDCGT